MKTKLIETPGYPYPIHVCVKRGNGFWNRMICAIVGHLQCGLHWGQNEDQCCRCSQKG